MSYLYEIVFVFTKLIMEIISNVYCIYIIMMYMFNLQK